ncbi:MAG: prolyl oligopeptidase family serine peptidase [Hyphomonadaceae bacterium]|nr:prolyl oligopeptidase family serine peptidase [Hyphomonadaceae bacterium]
MPISTRVIVFAATLVGIAATLALPAWAKPPIEAFGETPDIRSMQLSPDGTKLSFLARRGDVEQVMIYDLATKKQEPIATVGEFKARGVSFASDDYVILTASKTTRSLEYFTDKFEDSSSFAINIKTKKSVQLLTKTPLLWPLQTGLHDIAGYDPSGKHVFMGAFTTDGRLSGNPPHDLLRVSLDTGVGVATGGRSGSHYTRDWVINNKGVVIAREDWDEKTGEYEIHAYDGERMRTIYEIKDLDYTLGVAGVSKDDKSLIVTNRDGSEFYALFEMALADGKLSAPIMKRADADIEGILMDRGRVLAGVSYSGMFPSYDMVDPALDADIKGIQAKLPDSAVAVDSWSRDWSRLLIHISGGGLSERYAIFDRKARTLDLIAETRPAIKPEHVGQLITIEYKASDGLKIPALITWPTGIAEADRKNLPLIVLPHGGPEAYDGVGFDWMAQYFANEGYAVLQPNFRGSGGFGESFAVAGHGQWGRKMQSDITDGVNALVKMGWTDRNRVCIVGGSYGGYAALAGGAMTPDLYKCVIAVAGVSDLPEMLVQSRRDRGPKSSSFRYWTKVIGDVDKDRPAIEAISPVNLAANFKAPVLLIHGTDDTVVLIKQSDRMEAALKKAGKDVTYLKLKGDDHNLSNSDNRRDALEAMGAFAAKHIGPGRAAQ